jgi:hypothetical protein
MRDFIAFDRLGIRLEIRKANKIDRGSGNFLSPCYYFGSGGWIRTNDLRVMSPTSYLTAPPRINVLNLLFIQTEEICQGVFTRIERKSWVCLRTVRVFMHDR